MFPCVYFTAWCSSRSSGRIGSLLPTRYWRTMGRRQRGSAARDRTQPASPTTTTKPLTKSPLTPVTSEESTERRCAPQWQSLADSKIKETTNLCGPYLSCCEFSPRFGRVTVVCRQREHLRSNNKCFTILQYLLTESVRAALGTESGKRSAHQISTVSDKYES